MLLRRLLSVAIGKGDIAVQGVCNHLPDAFSRRFSEAQRLSMSKVPPEFSQFATDVRDLMLQGYSRYSLREPLHFGADFPGLAFVTSEQATALPIDASWVFSPHA